MRDTFDKPIESLQAKSAQVFRDVFTRGQLQHASPSGSDATANAYAGPGCDFLTASGSAWGQEAEHVQDFLILGYFVFKPEESARYL